MKDNGLELSECKSSEKLMELYNIWTFETGFNCGCLDSDDDDGCDYEFIGNTQEEVIIKAIEYLVDNDLIK